MTSHAPLVAPHLERLTPYLAGKPVKQLERELGIRAAIKLASNENPFGPSAHALEAAARALAQGHRYPDGRELRAALAVHHGVSPAELVLGNGSNELIDLLARTFGEPGAHVVYPHPSFVVYRSASITTNMQATEVPLREHLHYDVDAMIAALRPDTRLFFLAHPNNPTGAYLERRELERLLTALPRQTVVVIDEAYVEFADAPDFVSALTLRDLHPRLVVLRTFSKAYGLAAFRVGYGLAPVRLIEYLDRVRAPFNVSAIGLAAAQAALSDPQHVARYVAHNARERRRLTRQLTALGAHVAPSQANFLLVRFPNGSKAGDALLRRGIITRPMAPPIEDWIRITIGTEAENDAVLGSVRVLFPANERSELQW